MPDTHIHIHLDGGKEDAATPSPKPKRKPRKRKARAKTGKGPGLPKKYAKMGFKKGWREYKKTAAYKRKKKKR